MIAADVLVNGDDESSMQTIWYQCWKYSSIPTCIIHMRAGHAYMHSKIHMNIQDGAGQVTAAVQNAKSKEKEWHEKYGQMQNITDIIWYDNKE